MTGRSRVGDLHDSSLLNKPYQVKARHMRPAVITVSIAFTESSIVM